MTEWTLILVLLSAATGEEISREPLGKYDEVQMCMKAAMSFGAREAQKGVVMSFQCAKVLPNQLGPQA